MMMLLHKNIKSQRGVSLVELLIAMLIASILILSLWVVSRIAISSHAKYYRETQVYADISYGFKLMQRHVRESKGISVAAASGNWVGSRVVIRHSVGNNSAFGIYYNAVTNTNDFVYVPDVTNETNREVITSVPVSETITLLPTLGTGSVTVQVHGEKGGIPFDMKTVILRRA
ncbi:MAG: prepilin-type N-terminal cleavage/methylation domain-containing protein [Candidatus Omnitrophica bacterium]|nr:prepilin-type N-terminal cleavage/methylation domain-containing protein [Candidatus Omnitrophota bacterium]